MDYTLRVTVPLVFADALAATRQALAEQGFGVLTEVDLAATMKSRLDVDLPPQVIIGACRTTLAYEALQADPSIAAVLPCNVVVRADVEGCVIEALNPDAMLGLAEEAALDAVATDTKLRLLAALRALAGVSRSARVPEAS